MENNMAYLSARLFKGFDSPREFIERVMSVGLCVKCIIRMIDFIASDVGGDCATREGFHCLESEVLAEFRKRRILRYLPSAHLIMERKW